MQVRISECGYAAMLNPSSWSSAADRNGVIPPSIRFAIVGTPKEFAATLSSSTVVGASRNTTSAPAFS